jgi:hypothetical protein
MSFATEDLKATTRLFLLDEAKAQLEYDARRYKLDVIDDSVYAGRKPTASELAAQQARFAEFEAGFAENEAECAAEAKAVLLRKMASLATHHVARARVKLGTMLFQTDAAQRKQYRALLAEHSGSEAAMLFVYLMLRSEIEWSLDYDEPMAGSEARFADEVAEATGSYDGTVAYKALDRCARRYQVRIPSRRGELVVASFDTWTEAVKDAEFRQVNGEDVRAVDAMLDSRKPRKRAA